VAGKVLVAAVLVLAAVAAADALRRDTDAPEPAPRPVPLTPGAGEESPAESAEALRDARVRGTIAYTDEHCTLRAVRLPDLAPATRPRTGRDPGCAFSLSPDGTRAASPGAAWTADSRRVSLCRGRTVGIAVGLDRAFVRRWQGCAPAWRPDGGLTVVRHGAVTFAEDGGAAGRGEETLVGAAAVGRALSNHLDVTIVRRRGHAIVDVTWLSPTRAVLLVDVVFRVLTGGVRDSDSPVVAFFERGHDVAVYSHFGRGELTRLVPSPRGRYVSVRPDLLLRSDGSRVSLPDWLRDVRAIELSPDDRWVAIASRGGVYLIRTWELDLFDRVSRSPQSIRLPFVARDLAWR
jgi:hypothetical protein